MSAAEHLDSLPPVRGRITRDAPLARLTWFRVGGPADVLVKLYTLFILRNKITVLGKHIQGLDNVDADTNSRNLLLAKQAADENVAGTLGGIYSSEQTREMRCRTLLMRCVTQPDKMRGQALVKELMLLGGSRGAYA